MIRFVAISIILSTLLVNNAYAEQKKSKNARKAIKLIKQVGVDSPMLEETVYFIDDRYDDGYLHIARGDYEGVNLRLQHTVNSPDYDNLEIRIAPHNSDYEFTMKHDSIMVRYSTTIDW